FFFSSRRRHTRFSRDWSSDVCSSDLEYVYWVQKLNLFEKAKRISTIVSVLSSRMVYTFETCILPSIRLVLSIITRQKEIVSFCRSEERRVGKESMYRLMDVS